MLDQLQLLLLLCLLQQRNHIISAYCVCTCCTSWWHSSDGAGLNKPYSQGSEVTRNLHRLTSASRSCTLNSSICCLWVSTRHSNLSCSTLLLSCRDIAPQRAERRYQLESASSQLQTRTTAHRKLRGRALRLLLPNLNDTCCGNSFKRCNLDFLW